MASAYRREQHAAHAGDGGWDLEEWDATQAWSAPKPADVPGDARQSHGYIDANGAQHVIFRRRAPMTGPRCPYCPASMVSP